MGATGCTRARMGGTRPTGCVKRPSLWEEKTGEGRDHHTPVNLRWLGIQTFTFQVNEKLKRCSAGALDLHYSVDLIWELLASPRTSIAANENLQETSQMSPPSFLAFPL